MQEKKRQFEKINIVWSDLSRLLLIPGISILFIQFLCMLALAERVEYYGGYNLSPGDCIACYTFDENNGSSQVIIYDFNDTNKNNGRFYALNNSYFTDGKKGRGIHFNYTNVTVSHNASLNFTGVDFTIFFWMRTSSLMDDADIIRKGTIISAPNSFWKVEIINNKLYGSIKIGSKTYEVQDTSVNRNDGVWHSVTFKRNASSLSLRVDGVWQNSIEVPSSIPSDNAAILSIGAKGDQTNASPGQNFFLGDMDEIRIYDGELSDENIRILEEAQTTIAMVGDPMHSFVENELNRYLDQILKRSPSGYVDAAIMLGDADYIGYSSNSFMYFKALSTAKNIPWFFTMGNHELDNVFDYDEIKNQYGKNLTPGITLMNGPAGTNNTTFSFEVGKAHVIIMNEYWDGSNDGSCAWNIPKAGDHPDSCMKYSKTEGGYIPPELHSWISGNLNDNVMPLTIVTGHEPMRPGKTNHVGDSLDKNTTNRDKFESMLASYNLTLFAAGHTHQKELVYTHGLFQANVGKVGAERENEPDVTKDLDATIIYASVNNTHKIITMINGSAKQNAPNAWSTVTALQSTFHTHI
ncbi:MAG: metallophosphoesterase [Candidatus Methanoperedens sp.]|nr:metallophosphoesterase [Candidatus Methanoperedens sp.]